MLCVNSAASSVHIRQPHSTIQKQQHSKMTAQAAGTVYMQQRASLPTLNHSDQHCTQTYTGKTLGITSTTVIKRTLSQMGLKQGQQSAFKCSSTGREGSPSWENAPNHGDSKRQSLDKCWGHEDHLIPRGQIN